MLSCGTGLGADDLCWTGLDEGSCSKYGGSDGCNKHCKEQQSIPYVLGGKCKPVGSELHCVCCLGLSQ